jgi:predicted nucleic acid-binding protein
LADRRYWDSSCFIAWLAQEAGRYEDCGSILKAAEDGKLEIVTSALTVTEVLWPKGRDKLSRDLRAQVNTFFRHRWITIVQVDRLLAEEAQDFVWDRNIHPKDAIHVASAIRARVYALETYDGGLIQSSGHVGGVPLLEIRKPARIERQPELDLGERD